MSLEVCRFHSTRSHTAGGDCFFRFDFFFFLSLRRLDFSSPLLLWCSFDRFNIFRSPAAAATGEPAEGDVSDVTKGTNKGTDTGGTGVSASSVADDGEAEVDEVDLAAPLTVGNGAVSVKCWFS